MKLEVFIRNFIITLTITLLIIIGVTLIELSNSLVKCYLFPGSKFIEVVNECYRFR